MPLISSNSKTPALYLLAGAGSVVLTNLAAAQAATGMTFNCLEVFNTNVPNWTDWENPWFATDSSQGYTGWVAADPGNRQLIVSYNMISTAGGSMSDPLTWETNGANGAFNTHATNLAATLVAAGLGYSIIRLGLECNGNWNIDSIGGSTPGGGTVQMRNLWAQTFAQEVTAMRAVSGAHFLFCWCPNAVVAGVPFADYYPGDAYVDIIGIDAYDAFANGSQPTPSAATTTSLFGQAYGLTDITNFAISRGKPLALGEYGTQLGGTGGGLGDDQYYIQGIASWVSANNVAFHSYFDSNNDNIIPLSSTYPQTLAAYTAAFAPGGVPVVSTGAATGITSSAATLNGTVNPKGAATTYQFEYGPTTAYGTVVPASPGSAGSGSVDVAESYSLTGLLASQVYHFRINATNASGTVHGLDKTFTTSATGTTTRTPFTVSASVDNFNDGGALKIFVITGVTEAGGASATLQAFDPGGANVTLTPSLTGSLPVFGIFTRATTALIAAANNTLSDSGILNAQYFFADGRYTGTVTSGVAETVGSSTSVPEWNDIVAYELRKSGTTAAIDASSPAAVTGNISPLTVPSFTPTASAAVLVAVVMCSVTGTLASNIVISDTSGLGLVWTQRAKVTQTGSYAGVAAIYTATLPAAGISGAPSTGIRLTPSAIGSKAGTGAPSTGIRLTASAAGTPGGAANSGAPSTGITLTPSAAGIPGVTGPPVFPGKPPNPLGLKVELLLGSTWTDITRYVYQRNSLHISGAGRPDWTSALQAAELDLTLDNRDGRFSPRNSSGAYYPNIVRNAQLRVSVQAQSVTGVTYSGYRFWGEVSEWPPKWDPSSRDIYCDITVSGIWRRMTQLQTTLGSAYRRYNVNTAASTGLRSYWPMEDGTGSGQLVPYGSVANTANAVQSFVTGQAGLSLAASSDFKGSDAIPVLNAAQVIATVPAGGTATNNVTRFLMSVPANGDSASGTTNWNLIEIDSSGTVAKFEVYLNASGTLLMQLRNSSGVVVASGTTTTSVKGTPYLVSCELVPSGGNVAFALRIIKQGATGITESMTGTLTTASVGAVSTVKFNRSYSLMDTAVGHLGVAYSAPTSMVQAADSLDGYTGEFAMDRFTRICAEMGIATETIGVNTATAPMGPQVDATLSEVLQSVEDTDCGLLYELRNRFGLGYRANASMANQSAAVTLSYTAAVLDTSLAPAYDDQLTRNNITISNYTGYTQQAILTIGAMSIQNPPNGIGNGYSYQRQVNAAADSQLAGIANWLLNVGAVDEMRFPVITVKMNRTQLAAQFAAIGGLRPGDYLQMTNMPSYGGTATAKQLIWGYSEILNATEWTVSFSTVPETPYETGFTPGTIQLAQIPGGSPVTSSAPGSSGLSSLIANGSITPAMLSSGITVHTLGGSATTISLTAPLTPNLNDLWIASATGLISQWNGTSWVPFKFDASATIQAGTVVASNIASSTITASLLAAGIVVSGIVDATTITGATLIATGSSGEILVYSGTPGAGNLITSISGAAGTDAFSNTYAKGIEIQGGGLTLDNQGSAPPAVAGASTFYSSVAGRPRYKSQAGDDSVLERSAVNVAQFSCGNTTTPTAISAALSYLAGEGSQSSEYEIEVSGQATFSSSGTNHNLDIKLYLDGSNFGGGFTLDNSIVGTTGIPVHYVFRFTVSVLTTGTGGTVHIQSSGIWRDANAATLTAANAGAVGGMLDGAAFNTTVNHTLEIRASWGLTGTGQICTTYRTKLARRM